VLIAVAHDVVGEVAEADSGGDVGGERGGVLAHSVLLGTGDWMVEAPGGRLPVGNLPVGVREAPPSPSTTGSGVG